MKRNLGELIFVSRAHHSAAMQCKPSVIIYFIEKVFYVERNIVGLKARIGCFFRSDGSQNFVRVFSCERLLEKMRVLKCDRVGRKFSAAHINGIIFQRCKNLFLIPPATFPVYFSSA